MFTADINTGLIEYKKTEGAVLLDVRTPMEYAQGHIPGSINVPLQAIEKAGEIIESKDTPVFVYCYSGSRSHHGAGILSGMGYCNVKNIGGIASYTGEVE